MAGKRRSFRSKVLLYLFLGFSLWLAYYYFWGRHLYLVTAYCNCPICINVPKYHDNRFASGRPIYWGAVAADSSIPFGSAVELIPHLPQDWLEVAIILNHRRHFTVEDRGGKIRGRHIDLFIPDSLGGHKTALNWGRRRMRLKINGRWAE